MREEYLAFLRAINVGGRFVKMPLLRQIFEELGFDEVDTFIASGNVIFRAQPRATDEREELIQQGLHEALGFDVPTFLRDRAEFAGIVQLALEIEESDVKPDGQLLVGFLREPPGPAARARLGELADEVNSFRIEGRELYWCIGGRISDSGISGNRMEKHLGMLTTTRNVRTLHRLAGKLGLL